MDKLVKYREQKAVQNLAHFEDSARTENVSGESLVIPILRRWRIALLTFLLVCAIGIPVVWMVVKPFYQATAAIRVAPIIASILFGGDDSIPMYKNFMYTQADLIMSDKVLQRVADDLIDKDLVFFKGPDNGVRILKSGLASRGTVAPVVALKGAISSRILRVAPENNTELIKIRMKSVNPKEAEQIVNSFMRAYMAIVVSMEAKGG